MFGLLTPKNVVQDGIVHLLGELCDFFFEGKNSRGKFLGLHVTIPVGQWLSGEERPLAHALLTS